MIQLILMVALIIYIIRNADFDNASCEPNEECKYCPFPCEMHKN